MNAKFVLFTIVSVLAVAPQAKASVDVWLDNPTYRTAVVGESGVIFADVNIATDRDGSVVQKITFPFSSDTDGVATGGVFENDIASIRDHISSCSLSNRITGQLIAGPVAVGRNGTIGFRFVPLTLSTANHTGLRLTCNLSHTQVDAGNADLYKVTIRPGDIIIDDANGDQIPRTNIHVGANGLGLNIDSVATVKVEASGYINIEVDPSTPTSDIMLGSSSGKTTSKFRVTAYGESMLTRDLTIDNCLVMGGNTDGDCADANEVRGADNAISIVTIRYQDRNGATVTNSGFLSQGNVVFHNMSMYTPKDNFRTFTVSVDTNAVSQFAATSGSEFQLNVNATRNTGTFTAIGEYSGVTITQDDVDAYLVASKFVIRKTRPTISLASGSPSGVGVPGIGEVLQFNVASDGRGFTNLRQFVFKVTSNDETYSGWNTCDRLPSVYFWDVYNILNSSQKIDDDADWMFLGVDGGPCRNGEILGYAVLSLDNDMTTPPEEIGGGEVRTYAVRNDTTNANSGACGGNNALRLDIISQTEADEIGLDAIRWDDDTEAVGLNANYIRNLPIVGGTIVY